MCDWMLKKKEIVSALILVLTGSLLLWYKESFLASSGSLSNRVNLMSSSVVVSRRPVSSSIVRLELFSEGTKLSWFDVVSRLASGDLATQEALTSSILDTAFAGALWECKPVTWRTAKRDSFEFVVVKSDTLARFAKNADSSFFSQIFSPLWKTSGTESSSTMKVISFWNLGKDARLVSPVPASEREEDSQGLGHLMQFLQSAHPEWRRELWKQVGLSMLETCETNPDRKFWLSTSGLGVPFLHVRIDTTPKYYAFSEFKNM